jgi:glutamate racemase
MNSPSKPIGMFDSGVGGLTVMHRLIETLPNESVVYFGDTARIPYGEKSPETIIRFSLENAQFLMEKQIKLLVVACNTATAHAFEILQQSLPIPVVGVIAPGAAKAARTTRTRRIAVLATKGTVKSGVYERQIREHLPDVHLISIACPLFVPLVEEQFQHHLATKLVIKEYLHPLKGKNIDTVLLGCTHYPLLHQAIQEELDEELGPQIQIIDSAQCCADAVAKELRDHQLASLHYPPDYQYYVSDDPQLFHQKGEKFLGRSISHVSHVSQDRTSIVLD